MTAITLKPTSIKPSFVKMYREAFDNAVVVSRQDPSRLYYLRCSQLPYCSSAVVVNHAIRGKFFAMDMGMAYYVGVGHAVHEVMQRYLSQSGKFVGNYSCRECGKKYPLSTKYECCDFPTQYDEVEIDYKGIKGHVDGIYEVAPGEYYVIDYKTLSLATKDKKASSPPKNYVRQIRSYAYLLKKQFDLNVVGVMLVFIPRDNPSSPTFWERRMTPKDFVEIHEELKADRSLHRKTMMASTLEELMPLLKHKCGADDCRSCASPMSSKLRLVKPKLSMFPIQKDKEVTV